MNEKDLQIENLLEDKKKQKKIDGKSKGNRTELNLCKILTGFFNLSFTRSIGSGNRWGQVKLSDNAKQVFTGDICVPEGFKWVIESKGGYEKDIDLNGVCDGGISRLDFFIEQSLKDSEYCGRKPLICWKRNRKPWLSMILLKDLEFVDCEIFEYRIHYRDWLIIKLEDLLNSTKKDFWFK